MDMTWITPRIAVGGGIWNAENMAEVARAGITHVIDMQIEFDDTELAAPYGIEVLWTRRTWWQAVHSLCRRRAPRAHDDAGLAVLHGMGTGQGVGTDRGETSGGGFS